MDVEIVVADTQETTAYFARQLSLAVEDIRKLAREFCDLRRQLEAKENERAG
jgi:hypothetical protein